MQQAKERLFAVLHEEKERSALADILGQRSRHKKFRDLTVLATVPGPKHGLQVRFPSTLKAPMKAVSFAFFIPSKSYVSLKRNFPGEIFCQAEYIS